MIREVAHFAAPDCSRVEVEAHVDVRGRMTPGATSQAILYCQR
jgi:hypothetical protein